MQEHHPLVGREILVQTASALIVRPAPDCARFSLRIDPAALAAASSALGLTLPDRIGETASSEGKRTICLGPDEWYLLVPHEAAETIERAFADLYPRMPHSLADIGHREVGIEVEGAGAVLALQSAVTFDVEAMVVGTGCRTIFDKAQIVLIRETQDRFRIEVWRSFADHVWGILQAASREIALEI